LRQQSTHLVRVAARKVTGQDGVVLREEEFPRATIEPREKA